MQGLAMMGPGKTGGKKEEGAILAGKIVGMLFADRTWAHMAHLKTPKYSRHKALNAFYDEVVDLADSFAEVSQGFWGKLDINVGNVHTDLLQPDFYLEERIKEIRVIADKCEKGSLRNIMDEIEALYVKTVYLIRELA